MRALTTSFISARRDQQDGAVAQRTRSPFEAPLEEGNNFASHYIVPSMCPALGESSTELVGGPVASIAFFVS